MLIVIPGVLPRDQALALGRDLAAADWVDGNATSGPGAALAKRNRQLPEASAAAARGREAVQRALAASPVFLSAALPRRIYPPLFNRYGPGEGFDGRQRALRSVGGPAVARRSARSAAAVGSWLGSPCSSDPGDSPSSWRRHSP